MLGAANTWGTPRDSCTQLPDHDCDMNERKSRVRRDLSMPQEMSLEGKVCTSIQPRRKSCRKRRMGELASVGHTNGTIAGVIRRFGTTSIALLPLELSQAN
jgi:hypothetical protein